MTLLLRAGGGGERDSRYVLLYAPASAADTDATRPLNA
mgnify:FL=1